MRPILRLYREAYSGLSHAVWLIAFVSFVNRSGAMVLAFLALYLKNELGFTVSEAGLILTLYGAGSLCGMTISGHLIDRLGPVPIQVVSLFGMGLGFLVLGQATSGFGLSVIVFATSVVGEAFRPASVVCLAAMCTPATRAKAFALNRLAINLGVAIGPVAGGYLATRDYSFLFLVDGLTCMAAALILFGLRQRLSQEPAASKGTPEQELRPEGSPWSDRTFIVVMLVLLGVAVVFLQMFSTLPIYFEGVYGFDLPTIGWLFGINPILIVLFEMILVHRLASRPPLRVARWGVLLVGLGFGLMPLGAGFGFAALTIAIWAFGEMLESPFMATFVANRAGAKNRGRYMAAFMTVYALAFIIAPLIGTFVYERFGPDTLWFGCAGIGLLAFLAYSRLAQVVDEEESPESRVSS